MGSIYLAREGDITAVDSKTQLTTLGAETAPGPLIVPAGKTRIHRILLADAHDGATIAATGCNVFFRFEGAGLPQGPETLAAIGLGLGTAVNTARADPAVERIVDFPCTPGNEIQVFAEMAGTDIGTVHAGATLEFR